MAVDFLSGRIRRRSVTKALAAGGLVAAAGAFGAPMPLRAQTAARVVVIGGGPGGTTMARFLKQEAPELQVTLVEANPQHTTCFYSNLYLGGLVTFEDITHGYDRLRALGVEVVQGRATGVDAAARSVTLEDGTGLAYDKLVLSPGIDMRWGAIEGYDEAAAEVMPHAYRAGPQTRLLKEQVMAMPEGGTFLMVAPPNPYRCPPGPYERVSMIAHQLKQHNPTAKILILDAKPSFSKQGLFEEAWARHYSGMIEWVPGDFGGKVVAVDPAAMTVTTEDGDVIRADVVNCIPPQQAGAIAAIAGATDESGWCPVAPESMASTILPDVVVLGDASIAGDMPKSGFSANSQAKVAAMVLRHELTGSRLFPVRYRNTCWSSTAPEDTVKIGANYEPRDGKITSFDGFVSAVGEPDELRREQRAEADAWYASIIAETFGTA
jgi:NADPH-dependent 2,4-dienoyl-CoA reductase/sulfur reductase-like enzyme